MIKKVFSYGWYIVVFLYLALCAGNVSQSATPDNGKKIKIVDVSVKQNKNSSVSAKKASSLVKNKTNSTSSNVSKKPSSVHSVKSGTNKSNKQSKAGVSLDIEAKNGVSKKTNNIKEKLSTASDGKKTAGDVRVPSSIQYEIDDSAVLALIDKVANRSKSNENIKNNSTKCVEDAYYVGMVGDKRTSKGLSLNLTMEEYKDSCSWLLVLGGNDIDKNNLVRTSLQINPTRFVIDVNTARLKDKVVSFTYQMPKHLRLRYGSQSNGYRIVIDLPADTKISVKNVIRNQMSFKLVNKGFCKEVNKGEGDTGQSLHNNVFNDFDGLKTLGNSASFRKIAIAHSKPYLVAIDAGHGGIDSGAVGANGVKEKNVTLMYAKSLKSALQKRGFRVIMTRDTDKTVSLLSRVKIAQSNNADIFVSLHTDAHNDCKVSGTTVYRLSHLGEKHPDWNKFYYSGNLPERYESYKRDRSVLDILVGLTHQSLSEKSSILVDNILLSFKKNGVCKNCRHGQRSLAVLRGLKLISVLIEIGYISNTDEAKKMLLATNVEKFSSRLADIFAETFN